MKDLINQYFNLIWHNHEDPFDGYEVELEDAGADWRVYSFTKEGSRTYWVLSEENVDEPEQVFPRDIRVSGWATDGNVQYYS